MSFDLLPPPGATAPHSHVDAHNAIASLLNGMVDAAEARRYRSCGCPTCVMSRTVAS